ncbi:MAG: nucleotide sugar dehydrogenase [Flavobacteriaceae bacterium]|jgi:UDPglucose 6-dehydrogenase|nr:nucleotide sugar dehydrogenase [Flavobacteriaceae bacterium]
MKIKSICCIGAGYVGGPTMAVIALKCPEIRVVVVDNNSDKINQWNNSDLNNLPVYEPGLREIIKKTRNKNLFFSNEIDSAIQESEMIFLAVNTPTKKTGKGAGMASDLTYIEKAAIKIAEVSKTNKIIVEKSTLPVRTAEKIKEILTSNSNNISFEVLSNPEFLAEGTAIDDLFKSDRVLIGGDQTPSGFKAINSLKEIYLKWIPENKILTLNVWSSELSKLASNAMLAQRISSINSLSALCEKTGADIDEVSRAIGMDCRIGPKFLKVSPGFGGSCFKKDILNLVYLCRFYNLDEVADYWLKVVEINNYQMHRIVLKIENYFSSISQKKEISILGWAFKKDTNDSRESASIYITSKLLERGFVVNIYDPMVTSKRIINDLVDYNNNPKDIILNKNVNIYTDFNKILSSKSVFAILTEWDDFTDLNNIKKNKVIFDFRNMLDKKAVEYRF